MDFKVISDHAEATADGAVHAPYSVFSLTKEQAKDPFNAERIEQGIFVQAGIKNNENGGDA